MDIHIVPVLLWLIVWGYKTKSCSVAKLVFKKMMQVWKFPRTRYWIWSTWIGSLPHHLFLNPSRQLILLVPIDSIGLLCLYPHGNWKGRENRQFVKTLACVSSTPTSPTPSSPPSWPSGARSSSWSPSTIESSGSGSFFLHIFAHAANVHIWPWSKCCKWHDMLKSML